MRSGRVRLSETKRRVIAASQKWECARCRNLLPARFEIDHIVPLCNGGDNALANLQAICSNCHSLKTCQETMRRHDKLVEKLTRTSRYFNPTSIDYTVKKYPFN